MMTVLATKTGVLPVAERKAWPISGMRGSTGLASLLASSSPLQTIDLLDRSGALAVSYAELYRQQTWVNVVINKLSRGIARLPLKTFELDEQTGDRNRVRDHPLANLLERPYPRGSCYAWKEAIVGSLALYGNALAVKWRPTVGAPPSELWPLDWQNVRVIAGDKTPVDRYQYLFAGDTREFSPDEVVHFRWWSPDGIVGASPLEPLRLTLRMEDAAQRYGIASFANGVRPAGALVTDGEINDDDRLIMKAELASAHEGPDNAFRMMLLSGGFTWQSFSHTAQEAEVVAIRKLNREEVAAAYDIPPPMIGQLERATFSNIDEQHRMLYMDTFGPWLTMLEETIAVQLIDNEPAFEGVFVEFDLSEVLKGDLKTRFEAYGSALNSGWITRNEIRKLENLPAVDDRGADALAFPVAMTPLDGRIPSPTGTPVGTPPLQSTNGAAR